MMKKVAVLLLASAPFLSLPGTANAIDDVGYAAIKSQNWVLAEQQLLAGLQKNPDNVFRLLNLAWVYGQTGRKTEAAMIYQRIIDSGDDQLAALSSGEGRSVKVLAEHGLAQLQSGS
jgi:tetratricopeptide (TPR) repeat protein